jgi:magnesium-transporting ATPase (P-type)
MGIDLNSINTTNLLDNFENLFLKGVSDDSDGTSSNSHVIGQRTNRIPGPDQSPTIGGINRLSRLNSEERNKLLSQRSSSVSKRSLPPPPPPSQSVSSSGVSGTTPNPSHLSSTHKTSITSNNNRINSNISPLIRPVSNKQHEQSSNNYEDNDENLYGTNNNNKQTSNNNKLDTLRGSKLTPFSQSLLASACSPAIQRKYSKKKLLKMFSNIFFNHFVFCTKKSAR